MLPRNATDLDALLAWLVPAGLGIHIETNGRLYAHFAHRPDTGELLVHLINHEHPAKTACADVTLDVTRRPRSVISISMDDEAAGYPERTESFRLAGGKLTVPVEEIRGHRTVIVRFAPGRGRRSAGTRSRAGAAGKR